MKASKVVDCLAVVVTVLAVLDLIFLGASISWSGPDQLTLLRTGRIVGSVVIGVFFWIVARALEHLEVVAESAKDRCSDQTAKMLLEELKLLSAEAKERLRTKKENDARLKAADLEKRVAEAGKYPGDW